MKRKGIFLFILLLSCLGILLKINQDIFQYHFLFPYRREFTPESSGKGFYGITGNIVLKPGAYTIRYSGETTGKLDGYRIQDDEGNILAEDVLQQGNFTIQIPLNLSKKVHNVQFGAVYSGESSLLSVDRIEINCPHVLYKDSLLRHAVISLFILLIFVLAGTRLVFPHQWERWAPIWLRGDNEKVFWLLIALTAAVCFPFWVQNTYVWGKDLPFHLDRIEGIAESLRNGYFPARIHLFTLSDYGHGAGFFYPQVWLYFPALLRLLGFDILTCYALFTTVCTFFSLVSIYACTRKISGKTRAGIFAAVFYAFAAYRLTEWNLRGALGIIPVFIFVPCIIAAFYEIFYLQKQSWLLLAFGFWGVLDSHLISLVLCCLLALVLLLFHIRTIWKQPSTLVPLCIGALVTLAAGAFFLLPMLEQYRSTDLVINAFLSKEGHIKYYEPLKLRALLLQFVPMTYEYRETYAYPGLSLSVLMLLPLLLRHDSRDSVCFAKRLTLISLIFLWAATEAFPWQFFRWFLLRIQFSWRLLLIPTALLPMSGGILLSGITSPTLRRVLSGVLLTFSVIGGLPNLLYTCREQLVPYESFILENDRVGDGGEYLPAKPGKVKFRSFVEENQNTVLCSPEAVQISHPDRRGLSFTFDFSTDSSEQEITFEVPLIYYKGYRAQLTDADGSVQSLPVTYLDWGLTTVSVQGISEGTIHVAYEKTTVQKIGEGISLSTLFILLVYIFRKKRFQADKISSI